MDRFSGNYDTFKAIHEARMQHVRASAVAAGMTGRRQRRGLDRILAIFAPGRHRTASQSPVDGTAPEALFWA